MKSNFCAGLLYSETFFFERPHCPHHQSMSNWRLHLTASFFMHLFYLLCFSEDDGCSWNQRGQLFIRPEVTLNSLHESVGVGAEGRWRRLQWKSKRQGSEYECFCWLTLQSHIVMQQIIACRSDWGAASTCCHSFKVTVSLCHLMS